MIEEGNAAPVGQKRKIKKQKTGRFKTATSDYTNCIVQLPAQGLCVVYN
jgi:hypothetical protein